MRGAARVAFIGAFCVTGLAACTVGLATAAADPSPPVDPLIPVPGDPSNPPSPLTPAADGIATALAPQTLLGQFAAVAQSNPLNAMGQLLAESPQPAAVGIAPPPPGTISAPGSDPFTMAQLLMPQNYRMPTEEQDSPYALAPNSAPSPFARIDAWKGVHAMVHSNLGRMPGAGLGQPLPGTAPPPGTNLPPGLEQFYSVPVPLPPAEVPAAAPPVDPLIVPPTAAPPPN